MEGKNWCKVVPTTMWIKITYKNLILQACRLALLVLEAVPCDTQMMKPNFKSQYISHMMLNIGGIFSFRKR
jgi:hypothetical protein